MSKIKIQTTDSEQVLSLEIDHAQKLLKKTRLYRLVDEKFELVNGELKRKSNKGKDKEATPSKGD